MCGVQAQAADGKTIDIMAMGPVAPDAIERVASFIRSNTRIQVVVSSIVAEAPATLDAALGESVEAQAGQALCVIALVAPAESTGQYVREDREKGIVAVDVAALRPETGDAEQHDRRVERVVMAGIGHLMDLAGCPNPRCALFDYEDMETLDVIGRNFCPPCGTRVHRAAEERGACFIKSSPIKAIGAKEND
jgi:hypothetical protein